MRLGRRLWTGASREAFVHNDCFGYWARADPLAIGSWARYLGLGRLLEAGLGNLGTWAYVSAWRGPLGPCPGAGPKGLE